MSLKTSILGGCFLVTALIYIVSYGYNSYEETSPTVTQIQTMSAKQAGEVKFNCTRDPDKPRDRWCTATLRSPTDFARMRTPVESDENRRPIKFTFEFRRSAEIDMAVKVRKVGYARIPHEWPANENIRLTDGITELGFSSKKASPEQPITVTVAYFAQE